LIFQYLKIDSAGYGNEETGDLVFFCIKVLNLLQADLTSGAIFNAERWIRI